MSADSASPACSGQYHSPPAAVRSETPSSLDYAYRSTKAAAAAPAVGAGVETAAVAAAVALATAQHPVASAAVVAAAWGADRGCSGSPGWEAGPDRRGSADTSGNRSEASRCFESTRETAGAGHRRGDNLAGAVARCALPRAGVFAAAHYPYRRTAGKNRWVSALKACSRTEVAGKGGCLAEMARQTGSMAGHRLRTIVFRAADLPEQRTRERRQPKN